MCAKPPSRRRRTGTPTVRKVTTTSLRRGARALRAVAMPCLVLALAAPGGLRASTVALRPLPQAPAAESARDSARKDEQQVAATARPNILFCIADDWGWPHASAYGDAAVATPAFDRVAREGVRFDRAYAASPSCTPSRNAILTGQFHWRLGPGANLWSSLDQAIPVFPLLLEDAGYFVGHWRKSWGPGKLEVGGYTDSHPAGASYRGLAAFLQARDKQQPDRGQSDPGQSDRDPSDRDPSDRAAPFCFWLGAHDPHRPYKAGAGKRAGIDLSSIEVPPFLPDVPEVRSDLADYYAAVQRFDRDVGQALALLAARGELENTLVVVTGDHGMPFPRAKSHCYEMGLRVPLAMRWGSKLRAGQIRSELVSLTDLLPTFLAAAGARCPDPVDGRSLLSLAKPVAATPETEEQAPPWRTAVLFGKERHVACRPDGAGYPTRALRTDRWLYLHNFKPDRWPAGDPPLFSDTDPARRIGEGTSKGYILTHREEPGIAELFALSFDKRPQRELFDVQADPFQLRNLASHPEHAATLQKLHAQLWQELRRTADPRVIGGAERFDEYPYYGGGAYRKPSKARKRGR
ncbi:MAG: sulfatase [Planctomycetota bacterium]